MQHLEPPRSPYRTARALTLVAAAAAAPILVPTPIAAQPQQPGPVTAARLQIALERIVDAFPGKVGVFVRHLEAGVEAGVDAATPYPMASTYKVPILVEMMARVDVGEMSLDMPIELQTTDQHIGSGLLQDLWAPGLTLSLRNLATMMIILSDNSATDMLIDRLGAANITARMRSFGLDNIRVDRTTLELILDYLGLDYEPLAEASGEEIRAELAKHALEGPEAEAAAEAFYAMPQDTATARDMSDLLTMIARRSILTPESCTVILDILERTQTGAARIKGLLPSGTVVAHKTGTIGRVVDNVGIITLPDELGHVVISVFTLAEPGTAPSRSERVIADLARTTYDYFLFHAEDDDAR